MKKVLSVLVAVMFCMGIFATAASAASYDNLSSDEIAQILGVDSGDLSDLGELVKSLDADATSSEGDDALSGLGEILGGVDIASIGESLTSGDALSSLTGLFEGIDMSSFDISALTDMISGAFGDGGLDLSSLTSGLDLGSFDIGSLLGGGSSDSSSDSSSGSASDAATGATDTISSIMDGLFSGLSGLGIDTSMIEGLLDNDIVNFFANLYIGLGEVISPSSEEATTTTSAAVVTTTKPAVVTTSTPKTGDTSAVAVALATLAVAAGAAVVCLKKKED